MKIFSLILITVLFCLSSFKSSTSQNLIFAHRAGSDSRGMAYEKGESIAIDQLGNIYVTGSINVGTTGAVFGQGQENETIIYNSGVFIAKYTNDGKLVWVQQAGASNNSASGYAIALDKDNNVYVSGFFYENAIFGQGQVNETNLSGVLGEIFIAKYDQDGQLIWAKSSGGNGDDNPGAKGLTLDKDGNLYVTGNFVDTVTFGVGEENETTLTGVNSDIFVAKYNTEGKLQWVKMAGGELNDIGKNIALDSSGNVYITGNYRNIAYFGVGLPNKSWVSDYGESAFIAKYSNDGEYKWAIVPFSCGADDYGDDIKIDNNGDIIFTGAFTGIIELGKGTPNDTHILGGNCGDIVIAKYNSDGYFIWGKGMYSMKDERAFGLDLDKQSNIYVTGKCGYDVVVGNTGATDTTLSMSGGLFIAKFNTDGKFIRTTSAWECWEKNVSNDIAADSSGNCYITGYFNSEDIVFGYGEENETTLENNGQNDIFIAKYASSNNIGPNFTVIGKFEYEEDFDGTKKLEIELFEAPKEEINEVVKFSIETDTSCIVNYSFNDSTGVLTFTSKKDLFGEQVFFVTADDGQAENNIVKKKIILSILPVNDIPIITGQEVINMFKNTSLKIEITFLIIEDPDNNYPDDFHVWASEGDNYSVDMRTTIIPDENFVGVLTVPIRINDGNAFSNYYDLKINVIENTNQPVITGQLLLETQEETSLKINLSDITVTDNDNVYPDDFTLTIMDGLNYSVSGTTITPDENFYGTLTVPITVNDGESDSDIFNLAIEVSNTNDQPLITGQLNLEISEESSLEIKLSDIIVTDCDNVFPDDFSLSVKERLNYTVSNNTITPSLDYNGELIVEITVSDGDKSSPIYGLAIEVTPINDIPVLIGAISDIVTLEDTSFDLKLEDLNVTDPDNNYPEDFTLQLIAGSNYTISEKIIIPAKDYNGVLNVAIKVNDGLDDSNEAILNIEVTPVNDPPVILGTTKELETQKATPLLLSLNNFIVTDVDNNYPDDFSLNILDGAYYSVNQDSIIPDYDFTGNLNVNLKVNDGIENSPDYIATIVVTQNSDPKLRFDIPKVFSIYPNPSTNIVNIYLNTVHLIPVNIEIVNLYGITLESFSREKKQEVFMDTFSVEDYPTGSYIIRVRQSKKFFATRLIIITKD